MKNKLFLGLVITSIVIMGFVLVYRKNDNNPLVDRDITKSTPKVVSNIDDKIINDDGYSWRYSETKDEKLNEQNVKTWVSWISTDTIKDSSGFINFTRYSFGGCLRTTVKAPIDTAYVINQGKETKLLANDIQKWPKNQWVNFKIYYLEKETTKGNIFKRIASWLAPEVNASCRSYRDINNVKKIVFQFPEIQEQKTIEATKIYRGDDNSGLRLMVVPKAKQGLNLVRDSKQTIDEAFFIASISSSSTQTFLKLKNVSQLVEITSGKVPFNSLVDYTLTGNFMCSGFNSYCFFNVSRFVINTNLELLGDKMQIPFEAQFPNEKYRTYILEKEGGRYYSILDIKTTEDYNSSNIKVDLTDFVNNNPDKIDRDNNYNGEFIHGGVYIKGNAQCIIRQTKDKPKDLDCIVIPTIVEVKPYEGK